MKKEMIWNSFLAALITAIFAIVGWLSLSVIKLQNQYAAETAEKRLRQDITDVLNDVDKRLAVIEAVMILRHPEPVSVAPIEPAPNPDQPEPPPPPGAVEPHKMNLLENAFEHPRYDLRDQQKAAAEER